MERATPPGVILAGGAGRRIGGDKPLVTLAGRPLVDHVIDRLAPQCGRLAINANGAVPGLAARGLPVIPDSAGVGGSGPLAGVLAAMGWAAGQGADIVLTVPVDTPFLPRDLAARLGTVDAPIVLARGTDGLHGTCGLWDVSLRGPLAAALAAGTRKVTGFTDAHGAESVLFPEDDPPPFFNVNRPEDLAWAEARLARG